ncbi:MAG: hypothetical protein Q9185_002471 [Variospora sp. 1 TL-2023]
MASPFHLRRDLGTASARPGSDYPVRRRALRTSLYLQELRDLVEQVMTTKTKKPALPIVAFPDNNDNNKNQSSRPPQSLNTAGRGSGFLLTAHVLLIRRRREQVNVPLSRGHILHQPMLKTARMHL